MQTPSHIHQSRGAESSNNLKSSYSEVNNFVVSQFKFMDCLIVHLHSVTKIHTNTFCYLMDEKIKDDTGYEDEVFKNWKKRWNERILLNNGTSEKCLILMKSVNPLVIPRNHNVEEALLAANNNDLTLFNKLIKILKKPYQNQKDIVDYQSPSLVVDKKYQTFCGT